MSSLTLYMLVQRVSTPLWLLASFRKRLREVYLEECESVKESVEWDRVFEKPYPEEEILNGPAERPGRFPSSLVF